MPLFAYTARDAQGRIDRGTLNAASAEDVRKVLRERQLIADEIVQTRTPEPVVPGFTPAMPWTTIEDKREEKRTEKAMVAEERAYVPLVDTLRLFAGWLLAWYGLVFLLGDLQMHGRLPPELPLVEALFTSSIVLRFTFTTFLFLLLTSVHSWLGRGIGKGLALTIVGVLVFVTFHLNV